MVGIQIIIFNRPLSFMTLSIFDNARRLKRVVTINSYSSILFLFAVHPFIRPRKKDHFVSRLQFPLRSYSFSAINWWCEFGHGPRGVVEYHTNAFKLDVIRWRAHNGAKEINFPDSNYRFAHPACNCTDDDDSERLQPPQIIPTNAAPAYLTRTHQHTLVMSI